MEFTIGGELCENTFMIKIQDEKRSICGPQGEGDLMVSGSTYKCEHFSGQHGTRHSNSKRIALENILVPLMQTQ